MSESHIDVKYKGRVLEVYYDYQPEEKEVRYYSDGSGYPGCPEELEINQIIFNGRDITRLIDDQIDELEIYMLENRPEPRDDY